jgi:phenylalanine-4-hydroxylase
VTPTVLAPGGDGRAAVSRTDDGSVSVHLADDHPGLADLAYRARRDAIAQAALNWHAPQPPPCIVYSDIEHGTWATVCRELGDAWRDTACRSFLDAVDALALPRDHVPQLTDVTKRLRPLTGFTYLPVAGLAPLRTFYRSFGDRVFWSTQYLRHHSTPLYTPEPDLCHEVLGHAHQLADPRLAALYMAVADTVEQVESADALAFLSRIFWFTMEFGVVYEQGRLRAYGAGLLSSFGELHAFRNAEIRDVNWAAMGTQTYDITHYQPVLYAVPSIEWLVDALTEFLLGYDDEVFLRLSR